MRYKKGYHYRCRDYSCWRRVTLPQPLEHYVRQPRCHFCGSKIFLKNGKKEGQDRFYRDKYRTHVEINVKPCCCDGYGHVAKRDATPPHRIGSKYCMYRRDGTKRMPGDPDFRDPREDLYNEQLEMTENYDDVPF